MDKQQACRDAKDAGTAGTGSPPKAGTAGGKPMGTAGGGAANGPDGPQMRCNGENKMISGTISSDTTWVSGSTCVFNGDVTVAKGATLTIEEGVLIKSGANGYTHHYPLIVKGNLEIAGTSKDPVILTDIRDDGPGGDTNGDEGKSQPPGGSGWAGIRFESGSSGTIRSAEVHYATIAVSIDGAAPVLEDLRVRNCGTAVSALPTDEVVITNLDADANGWNGLVRRTGTIAKDTTWASTDTIYGFGGDITVAEGATLTIEPGLIVKSGAAGYSNHYPLIVKGTLEAVGTADQPVIFTDVGDDGQGGDTNNDEGGRKPGPSSWAGIQFDGNRSGGHLQHVEIYFAHAAVSADSSSPMIEDALLDTNATGLTAKGAGANPTITNSSFVGNGAGASVAGEAKITATNNWWGAASGPGGIGMGMGNTITEGVTFKPFLTKEP